MLTLVGTFLDQGLHIYQTDVQTDTCDCSVTATQLVCRRPRRRVWRGAFNILSSYLHFVRGRWL